MSLPPFEDLGRGIHCIDTDYQRRGLAACYLIRDGREAAFIDTGTAYTAPRLLALLDELKIAREQVRYVIPTHVHLDHAGGAGQLIAALPRAQLVIHPQGARHLIDPAKLTAGATAVYGEEKFKSDFDRLRPIAAERVIEAPDLTRIRLGGRELTFVDTPGHARHHFCVFDSGSQGFFTGDTFGICYPELATDKGPFIFATTTPVQFDPDAWHVSIDRLLEKSPQRMFLTHYGPVSEVEQLAARLHDGIDAFARIAREAHGDDLYGAIRAGVEAWFSDALDAHGCTLSAGERARVLEFDIDLNTQGLEVWIRRQRNNAA